MVPRYQAGTSSLRTRGEPSFDTAAQLRDVRLVRRRAVRSAYVLARHLRRPPGSTRGGRYGLLTVLGERLAPGCTILLDDAGRPDEREAPAALAIAGVRSATRLAATNGRSQWFGCRLSRPIPRNSPLVTRANQTSDPTSRSSPTETNDQKARGFGSLPRSHYCSASSDSLPAALGDNPCNGFGHSTQAHAYLYDFAASSGAMTSR